MRKRVSQLQVAADNVTLIIDGHHISISNPDKVLFPEHELTKKDLIAYYYRISTLMISYIKNYPLSLKRFPDGIAIPGFFQKDTPDYFPAWIDRVALPKHEGINYHVLCNQPATLVYLANQAAIELHPVLSQARDVHIPTKMIFDLDPSESNVARMRFVAKRIKAVLEDIGLHTYIMNTGSRGLHIIVLLKPVHTFDEVYNFAYDIARIIVSRHPDKATLQLRKNKRGKKIFIDVLRNGYGATAIAPFSVRAKKGAPVATPLSWEEFFRGTFNPQRYTITNVFHRLARVKNPWHDMHNHIYTLHQPRVMLDGLLKGLL